MNKSRKFIINYLIFFVCILIPSSCFSESIGGVILRNHLKRKWIS